jgi:hypothetical protein
MKKKYSFSQAELDFIEAYERWRPKPEYRPIDRFFEKGFPYQPKLVERHQVEELA